MKYLFPIIILVSIGWTVDSSFSFSEKTKLEPCPNSPNCVSTQETRKRKKMRPIPFQKRKSLDFSKRKLMVILEAMIKNIDATLIEEDGNYLRYEFKTKIGNFIDDVEFIFDEENKQIHFRSASRKGYGDFGKNRRRMKKIRRKFKNILLYD